MFCAICHQLCLEQDKSLVGLILLTASTSRRFDHATHKAYVLEGNNSEQVLSEFASVVLALCSSDWITSLLLYANAQLVLCCDRFHRGPMQARNDPVDLVTDDYGIILGKNAIDTSI